MKTKSLFILLPLLSLSCVTIATWFRPSSIGWRLVETQHSPSRRGTAAITYDTISEVAILFGGADEQTWFDDTWIWSGSEWIKAEPTNHPSARQNARMAYDESRQKVVLFGGTKGKALFDDTWEWDGSEWHEMIPIHKPPARCCQAMAYDPVNLTVLLYGGWDRIHGTFFRDTWSWDGDDWTELSSGDAPLASGHVMIGNPAQNEVIAVLPGEGTWSWNGLQWRSLDLLDTPDRIDSALAYDIQYHRLVLFGGKHNGRPWNDTWVFDGIQWNVLKLASRPPSRFSHVMFYDIAQHRLILFGGYGLEGYLYDTWELVLPENIPAIEQTPVGRR